MQIEGSYRIGAAPMEVWGALNDPEILRRCIPGCETLEKQSDTEFAATIHRKVGPINARFSGSVTLSDLVVGETYRISGEGKGGAAGLASGSVVVRLAGEEDGTRLEYEGDVQLRGKVAQLGARLMGAFAKKTAASFFDQFQKEVQGEAGEGGDSEATNG